jgi:hypothetical protein
MQSKLRMLGRQVQRPSLETNFKCIADFEADRLVVDIGRQR